MMKLKSIYLLAKRIKNFTRRQACAQFKFFGSCAEVPTNLKQSLADCGHSVTDVDGHYDIDGMSYNLEEGVIAAADPRPIVLVVDRKAMANTV